MLELRKGRPKRSQCKVYTKKMHSLIEELEDSLSKSQQTDRQIIMAVKLEHLRNQSEQSQLKEAQNENKQLLNILIGSKDNMTRISSDTTCTMSLVHLQYKYEELLANHNGLLKILDMRTVEMKKLKDINNLLNEEIETLRMKLHSLEDQISKQTTKLKDLRMRKNSKIIRLKTERDTLRLVHNRLTYLLDKQCLEESETLNKQIRHTAESSRALLLQEVRKNNILSYENFQQQQEIVYLQSILNVRPVKSCESFSSRLRILK